MSVPVLQSLLLADHVYRDQATGKHVICGVFSTIFFTPNPPPSENAPAANRSISQGPVGGGIEGNPEGERSNPENGRANSGEQLVRSQSIQSLMQAGSPYAYFSVTELTGRKLFEVRYVDLHENRVLFQAEVPVECDDPLKTIEISLPLPRLPLVAWEERVYALEIVCEGQLLGSHRVLARVAPGSAPNRTPQ